MHLETGNFMHEDYEGFALLTTWRVISIFAKRSWIQFSWIAILIYIWPDSVLIEIKVVRNYIMNNFKHYDQLSRIHSFHSKSLWSWQNSAISQKKKFFGQL